MESESREPIMKKSKAEYLKLKQKKQDAKKRESEHKVDYTDCPVRDEPVHTRGRGAHPLGDGIIETLLIMNAMRRKRKPIIPMEEMREVLP